MVCQLLNKQGCQIQLIKMQADQLNLNFRCNRHLYEGMSCVILFKKTFHCLAAFQIYLDVLYIIRQPYAHISQMVTCTPNTQPPEAGPALEGRPCESQRLPTPSILLHHSVMANDPDAHPQGPCLLWTLHCAPEGPSRA